ncbi:dehydrogenase [Trametes versicolor FP-101664 SS1]|uniref:dehydrogenase n=1 Tax=Trametes versicolor (strain FP-101664) TaxID=717944 RepID=UPI0004621A3F|nr:dehydrogenase [Trametes versicolor FP-101664 SS1]EIW54618.1 dehydrogenase [Trametes versicolor FP-101664 SS1]
MSPTTWLVTGANRGIGLEIVRQLLAVPTNLVVAACRAPEKATALAELQSSAKGALHLVQLDVSDFDNIRALPAQLEPILGSTGLDYLISNAGIAIVDSAFTLDPDVFLRVVRTNAAGPALLSQVLLPFLERAPTKKILHVSSTAGSIGSVAGMQVKEHQMVGSYAMSKAALNMLAYKQKTEKPEFTVITLCPGWVQTDMGGEKAALKPEESVAGIIKVITNATTADSGKYLRHNGEEIPW